MFPVELVFPLPAGGFHMARRIVDGQAQIVVKTLRAHNQGELDGLLRIGWKQQTGPVTIEGEKVGKAQNVQNVLPGVR